MTNDDAKFILRAYRSDGRYEHDALFREALERAHRDPALMQWLAEEQSLDEVVADKLEGVAPPTGLRDAILVGARASRKPSRVWWRHPAWLGAAAAAAIIAAVPFLVQTPATTGPVITATQLAHAGLDDMIEHHAEHIEFVFSPELKPFQTELASYSGPYSAGFQIDQEKLADVKCRNVGVNGLTAHEICFLRDGTWFHLYVVSLPEGSSGTESKPAFAEHDGYAAASWIRDGVAYALVVEDNIEHLRQYV